MSPDDDHDRLAQRYGRLLLAHPRWYRRIHGEDMITTLLDAATLGPAPAGVPTRQAVGLVLDGLRCRLRITGAGPRVLAILLSLVAAGTFAAAGGRLGWAASSADWPTVEQARTLAAPVLPTGIPDSVTRHDDPIGPGQPGSPLDSALLTVMGSPELEPGGVHLSYTQPAVVDLSNARQAAEARLAADGWRTSITRGLVIGERDGMILSLLHVGRTAESDDVVVSIRPAAPRVAYVLAVLGTVLGLLTGWLLTAAAVARTRRRSPVTRAGAAGLAAFGVAASAPACLLNLLALSNVVVMLNFTMAAEPPPSWVGYDFVLARPSAVLGGLLLIGAFGLSIGRDRAVARPITGLGPEAGPAR